MSPHVYQSLLSSRFTKGKMGSFFDGLKDPKWPLLAPNIWFLRNIGLILAANKLGKIICIILPILGGLFVFSQFVELYGTINDIDEVLTNIKISMLSSVCVVKAFTFLIWQEDWLQIFNYVTEADKSERNTDDAVRCRILDKYTKYCRRVTYIYWGLIFTTFVTTVGTPLLSLTSESLREQLRNGTALFPHVFKTWMPFDKYSSSGCFGTVVWHVLICAWGASIVAAYDSNVMVLLVFFGRKFELLQDTCKKILGSDGKGISDHEADKMVREVHQMHISHLRHMKLLNSVLSPVMFVYVVMCSLMLCASVYQFTTTTNVFQKLFIAEYLIFSIAQLFLFFWHSNEVIFRINQLSQGLYESEWWAANVKQRKSILLLNGQLCLSHVFTAGPFSNLTMSTFLAILKGAYSYYTLIRK